MYSLVSDCSCICFVCLTFMREIEHFLMDVCVLFTQVLTYIQVLATVNLFYYLYCGRISSVSRALDCRAVGREPGAGTILKVLK